jgi:hypothetical protein
MSRETQRNVSLPVGLPVIVCALRLPDSVASPPGNRQTVQQAKWPRDHSAAH